LKQRLAGGFEDEEEDYGEEDEEEYGEEDEEEDDGAEEDSEDKIKPSKNGGGLGKRQRDDDEHAQGSANKRQKK
jgi:hypothetical protein